MVLLATIGYVSAQSLRFEWQGTVYAEGETVVCTYVQEWGEMLQNMQLRNTTNAPIDVVVRKEHIEIVEGTANFFCWGSCFSPDVYISPRTVTLAGGAVSGEEALSFHHQIDPEFSYDPSNFIVGTSTVRYYAYPENNPDDAVSIIVKFDYNPVGVGESKVSLGHAYPNPASSEVRFNYEIGLNGTAEACVYNLLGQEVMRKDINSLQGHVSFPVDGLNDGIYFCAITLNGQAMKTEKFVVKK